MSKTSSTLKRSKEEAKQKVDRFVSRFEPFSYRLLAYHAALPLILTPELVHYLRVQFLRGDEVPWVAEIDLLLSDLCRQVGYEQYAMDAEVQNYLLQEMREQDWGKQRMQEVAKLLIDYVNYLRKTDPLMGHKELQAQQLAAMVYLDDQRDSAVDQLAKEFKQNLEIRDKAELARLSRLTKKLIPQITEHKELIEYASLVTKLIKNPNLHVSEKWQKRTITIQNRELPNPYTILGNKSKIDDLDNSIPSFENKVTGRFKVLILEANPQNDLSLNEEIRELEAVIERARDREQFAIKTKLAVRSTDLQQSILEFQPNIIHFCGHGTGEGGLVFRDKKIGADALSNLFALFKEHLQCVVLNACYSETQANEIIKHIDYVIGMNQTIRDDAAIAFSIGFYQALAYKRSFEDAFKFGKNAIQLKIVNHSISSEEITEETRKLIPIDTVPEITITEEYLKPVLKQKFNLMNSREFLYCNLPHRDCLKFIGREKELKELLKHINPEYRQHIAVVEGIGGVGKTALVLEVAYLCSKIQKEQRITDVEIPIFEAIIFTSAKKTWLTSQGILIQPIFEETLREIFRTIADVLNEPSIIMAQGAEQRLRLVYESLSNQRTLLIIDGMETISSQEQKTIISFLANLPESTQAIITSRKRIGIYQSIRIYELPKEESFQLIAQEAESKGISITDYEAKRFYGVFGGIPVALIYAVGQRAMGHSLKRILGLSNPTKLPKDLALFLFQRSVEPLRGQPAHKLLMSITFFQTAPSLDALVAVAGLQGELIEVVEGLAKLQQLSLVSEEDKRYSILPITHKYALDELAKYPEFLEIARNRWVEWCLRFTNRYGGKDWQDWRIRYDYLAEEWENIASVLYWCAAQNRYKEVKQLWQNIDTFIDINCDWRTRRHWWGWLIRQSDQRADLPTHVIALSERAWTLILMGDNEAEKELATAWKMRESADDLDVQAHLVNHIAVHRITQKKYNKALKWLQLQENLVNQAELEEKEQIRHQVCIAYYRGEIAYWKGKNTNDQEEFNRAKELFQWTLDTGKTIGWQRFTNYAQNWLADILIIDNDFKQARKLLKEGLFIAERNKEKRRIAHYQASYARLEYKQKNYEKVKEWANKALDIFDREGIKEDAEEMRDLLTSLVSS